MQPPQRNTKCSLNLAMSKKIQYLQDWKVKKVTQKKPQNPQKSKKQHSIQEPCARSRNLEVILKNMACQYIF